jgi:hypothetical protein
MTCVVLSTQMADNSAIIQNYEREIAVRSAKALKAAETSTGFVVAPGKALSCPRGVIDEGQRISKLDFADDSVFDERLAEGYIVVEPKATPEPVKAADDKAKK